jgi:hypothetical protein
LLSDVVVDGRVVMSNSGRNAMTLYIRDNAVQLRRFFISALIVIVLTDICG